MYLTTEQAYALHDAIEARDNAWRNFDSAARMPKAQMTAERLTDAADRFAGAELAVLAVIGVVEHDVDAGVFYLGGAATAPRPPGEVIAGDDPTLGANVAGDAGNGNAISGKGSRA